MTTSTATAAAITLKQQKEAFVTGHDGTTPIEILLVCLSAPVGIFLYQELRHLLLTLGGSRRRTGRKEETTTKLDVTMLVLIESFVLLLPMALCQTELLYPFGLMLLRAEGAMAVILNIFRRRRARAQRRTVSSTASASPSDTGNNMTTSNVKGRRHKELTFLTSYRSIVSYLTFVAILAVDFHIFPRRFAKTEVRGYGLMDLGAGSFVVSGGFVSNYARRAGGEEGKDISSLRQTVKPALIRSIPLVLMGLIRLITNKGLEYQEHVSEYGVHWNFFFTLSVVSITSSLIRWIGGRGAFWYHRSVPILLLVSYQSVLSFGGVQGWIETAPRRCDEGSGVLLCDFFFANREGILSCFGYLCLHLFSEEVASICLWLKSPSSTLVEDQLPTTEQQSSMRGRRLCGTCVVMWSILGFLTSILDIPVSRRSTNASFVVWTLAHNLTILFLTWGVFYLAEEGSETRNHVTKTGDAKAAAASSPVPSSPIFAAVNRHGLVVFIIANLLTGAVNLSINTLEATDGEALVIIFGYLCAVGCVALLLDWVLSISSSKSKIE